MLPDSYLAFSPEISSPQKYGVEVPPRAAYSHSASVSKRYSLPVFRLNQSTYRLVSCQLTSMTGRVSRPHSTSSGLYSPHSPSATHASHSLNVTSWIPTANEFAILTGCCESSLSRRCLSSSGEPIVKSPAGTTTMTGHTGQS